MKKNLLLFFTMLIILSCGSESKQMVYQTSDGEFGSVAGNFIADFPTKPGYSVIDNQIGQDKFQIHLFRSLKGPNKIFSIEYIDYPESMISSLTDEQVYSQAANNYANKLSKDFELDFQQAIKQHGLNGHHFILKLKQSAIDKGIKGHIQGKLFRKGNRVYTITYTGRDDRNEDVFMNSFRLIE